MNCQQAETWLIELARDSATAADFHADALRHLDACPRCAARLDIERAIAEDLRAVAAHDAHASAPAHVEANLLVAFRAQTDSVAHAPARVVAAKPARTLASLFFSRRAMAVCAVAALVLFTFAALRYRFAARSSRQTQTANAGAPVRPAAAETLMGTSGAAPPKERSERGAQRAAVGDTPHASATARPVGLLRKQTRREHTATGVREQVVTAVGPVGEMTVVAPAPAVAESVTEFMPLVARSTPPLTSGQLVRVEVSRSALAALGLPVNMARAGETMKADVLIGEDGLARAIRLVR